MDFLDATFYKQGVQQSEDWEYVKVHMQNFLKDVVAASYDLSRKGNINKPTERKAIIKKLQANYTVEDADTESSSAESDNHSNVDSKSKPSINDTVKNIVTEKTLTLEDGEEIKITFIEKEEDGHTKLYSLTDFRGLGRISSFQKSYRNGVFGALPNIHD